MIIVEGGDNTGKSTLVRQLVELDPTLRILDRPRFNPKRKESIGTSYLKTLFPADGDFVAHANSIVDRLVASEDIYGRVFRGGSRLTLGERLALRTTLETYRALVVWCDPPNETIVKDWNESEQAKALRQFQPASGFIKDDALKIADAYRQHIEASFPTVRVMRYDWTAKTAEDDRARIVRLHRLSTEAGFLAWWSALGHGIGSQHARIMIVGESPSPRATTPAPFAHGPAGEFLAYVISEVIERHGPSEYVITNAQKTGSDSRDFILLREEIRYRNPIRVIALGRVAGEMVRALNYPKGQLAELPHPMFWKRFHAREAQRYVDAFVNAVHGTFYPPLI